MANLQLFAEGDGDDGGAGDGNGNGDGAGTGSNGADGTVTFDDFLKGEGNQAEFDRRVQKAVNTAVTNAQAKWKALTDDKLSEAEKLAQMTKEEKAEYKASKLEKELEELKRQNARSDMAKTARKMLAEEEINIPDELLVNLIAEDADGTKKAVEAFSKMYKGAVQAAVKEALKGNPPRTGTGGKGTMTKEQILAVKNPTERQRLIAEESEFISVRRIRDMHDIRKLGLQVFTAPDGMTGEAQIQVRAREIDFVTSFGKNLQALLDILGITRMIRKENGSELKNKTVKGTLKSGEVGEGEEIPMSKYTVEEQTFDKTQD